MKSRVWIPGALIALTSAAFAVFMKHTGFGRYRGVEDLGALSPEWLLEQKTNAL